MTQDKRHKDTIKQIDDVFSHDDHLDQLTRRALPTDKELVLHPWYARFLTTLAVAVDGEAIQYLDARTDAAGDAIEVTIFTPTHVIAACIDMHSVSPLFTQPVQMAARGSITSLSLQANASSVENSRDWPGDLEIEVSYTGLTRPLRLIGSSHNSNTAVSVSPLWELLAKLRADLTKATN
jgi:hypothetical protein